MINPQNRNLSELNTCFFSSFDRLPHRVSHINFNLYHYAGNNPVKYLDPDGRICCSYYDYYNGKYGITTYSLGESKALNICYSILDFYPFGTGEIGKRAAEFFGSSRGYDNLRVIDNSTSKNYILNDITNYALETYGEIDNDINFLSIIANILYKGSDTSKVLGRISSITGSISNYIINPALLCLSVADSYSAIIDNFIVGVFGNDISSTTREGVENKYNLVKNTVMHSLRNGDLELTYYAEQNHIQYKINNAETFSNLKKQLNEME